MGGCIETRAKSQNPWQAACSLHKSAPAINHCARGEVQYVFLTKENCVHIVILQKKNNSDKVKQAKTQTCLEGKAWLGRVEFSPGRG